MAVKNFGSNVMGILASYAFKTVPGGLSRHLAITLEGRDRLRAMGFRAGVLRPVMGTEMGQVATVIQFDNAKAWSEGTAKINGDAGWRSWYMAAADEGVAEQVVAEMFTDLDPTYQPAAYGALKVFRNTQWLPLHGKAGGLMENVTASLAHIKRHGGAPRVLQCIEGHHPMTIGVSVGFESLAAAGAHLDALNADPAFQAHWTGVMANPTAQLVRAMTVELVD
jgi:hypothetical protein